MLGVTPRSSEGAPLQLDTHFFKARVPCDVEVRGQPLSVSSLPTKWGPLSHQGSLLELPKSHPKENTCSSQAASTRDSASVFSKQPCTLPDSLALLPVSSASSLSVPTKHFYRTEHHFLERGVRGMSPDRKQPEESLSHNETALYINSYMLTDTSADIMSPGFTATPALGVFILNGYIWRDERHVPEVGVSKRES